ncbi:MAG TPA: hypothetical protein VMU53_02260 [Candidatus Sulfotelmatobacter sp.]|nr:hypothetical protein [Candidatus Sulfotelmatobacter sp.]
MKFFSSRPAQLAALIGLLSSIGVYSLREKFCVIDFDTWWHLKVGDWILQNAALPHTGILSRTAAQLPWVAYSWGYEVLLSLFYSWFGLVGIGILGTLLTISVAWAIYWMLRRLSQRFWPAFLLTGVVCAAFLFNGAPRPVFFSYILFCLVLALLFQSQRSARIQPLYWLPLIFLFWANLHIQFIYGLFTVGMFAVVHLTQQALAKLNFVPSYLLPSSLPSGRLLLILVACLAATFVGPNFYHPYLVVLAYTKAKFSYKVILELQPLPFRYFSNFIELFLAAAGFYVVGWNKRIDPFKLALLVAASIVSFRTMRDAWFICFSAAACIADFPAPADAPHRTDSWREMALVTAGVAILLLLAAPVVNFNARGLDRAISADYPVNAVNFLRHNGFSGPLYNNLNWGGFLMWYLPELPVAVDGRNDLYGDQLDELFYNSQSAMASYKTDPYLDEAGLVILESKLPLAKILTIDPRFRLVYHDDIATVYARQ